MGHLVGFPVTFGGFKIDGEGQNLLTMQLYLKRRYRKIIELGMSFVISRDFLQIRRCIYLRLHGFARARCNAIIGVELPALAIHGSKSRSIVASSSGKIQCGRLKADGTPENVPMYPYEINMCLSDLSLLDFSAQSVPGAVYEDFDSLERERLRRILLAYNGEKYLLELQDEELDEALQFVTTIDDRLVPTYTGTLILGRREKI